MHRKRPEVLGADLNRSDAANLRDYNGLRCLPGHNCATGAQRFFPALSHRHTDDAEPARCQRSRFAVASKISSHRGLPHT
jgi:hypothetical protein